MTSRNDKPHDPGGDQPRPDPHAKPPDLTAAAEHLVEEVEHAQMRTRAREETKSLLHEAQNRFHMAQDDYDELAACQSMVDRALQLWPENEDAHELNRQITLAYVRVAIGYGDLWLARVKASRLDDAIQRPALLRQIEEAEERDRTQQRHAGQRALLVGVAILFAIGLAVVGLLLVNSSSRWHLDESKLKSALSDQKAAGQEYQKTLAEEKRRTRLLREARDFHQNEIDIAEQLNQLTPFPQRLRYRDEANGYAVADASRVRRAYDRRSLLRKKRQVLTSTGSALEQEPVGLALADANVALDTAGDSSNTLSAYELYRRASELRPQLAQPLVGMAVAAARGGHLTSASMHLMDAAALARTVRGMPPDLIGLAAELVAENRKALKTASEGPARGELETATDLLERALPPQPTVAATRDGRTTTFGTQLTPEASETPRNRADQEPSDTLTTVSVRQRGTREGMPTTGLVADAAQTSPTDIIIESRPEGQNHALYAEVEGVWADSNRLSTEKSAAPGLTPAEKSGTRRTILAASGSGSRAASAHFSPGLSTTGRYFVYVTWPSMANVTPMLCTVRHAAGETTLTLQQGATGLNEISNRWISLGEHVFGPGADQYVELAIPANARPYNPAANGAFYADAVRFSSRQLTEDQLGASGTRMGQSTSGSGR